MSWKDFLKSRGIDLLPWQDHAASAFLAVLQNETFTPHCGKTFLLKILSEYVNEHGSNIGAKTGGAA